LGCIMVERKVKDGSKNNILHPIKIGIKCPPLRVLKGIYVPVERLGCQEARYDQGATPRPPSIAPFAILFFQTNRFPSHLHPGASRKCCFLVARLPRRTNNNIGQMMLTRSISATHLRVTWMYKRFIVQIYGCCRCISRSRPLLFFGLFLALPRR